MFTADQLIAHAVGDYILQSDWMASKKTESWVPAWIHAICYTLPFLLLTTSLGALGFICVTHFVIDHWRLARHVIWLKNHIAPPWTDPGGSPDHFNKTKYHMRWWHPWSECSGTGYHDSKPPWLAVWLLIITDNVLHVLCNGAALAWL